MLIEHTCINTLLRIFCFYFTHYTADVDYVPAVLDITFDGVVDMQTISIIIADDIIFEGDEQFELVLKEIPDSPYDVIIRQPVATGIIIDNDVPSKIWFNVFHMPSVIHSYVCM